MCKGNKSVLNHNNSYILFLIRITFNNKIKIQNLHIITLIFICLLFTKWDIKYIYRKIEVKGNIQLASHSKVCRSTVLSNFMSIINNTL